MKYAVVKIGGTQLRVSEGDKVETSKLSYKEGEEIELKETLLLVEDDKVKIGRPFLENVVVKAKILKHFLGEKLFVFKFKAKTGYRRKKGWRSKLTLLEIGKIVS